MSDPGSPVPGGQAARGVSDPGRTGRFSIDTRELPSAIGMDAWRSFWQPTVQVNASAAGSRNFAGHATLRRLGQHVLLEMEATPADYWRPRNQGLCDGLDHWLAALRFGETDAQPTALWLGSLSRGFGLRGLGGRWLGVFIRPERLPQLAPVFATPRILPVLTPPARMLAGMLPRLAASVDEIVPEEPSRLEAVLSSMLVASLIGWEMRPVSTRLQLEAARRARVVALVDASLGDPDLSPASLVSRAGISRSELYRCFAPVGGIARAIQQRRLRGAYAQLARADGPASITRIREAVGFFDPSSFTRAFRREFGCTPSDVLAQRPSPAERPWPGLTAALSLR